MKKDYKNAAWVVELFNRCISKGNQYLEAKELDDNMNMDLALMDFGKDLGATSEITVRYLLYRYDNYEEPDKAEGGFYSLWGQLCNGTLKDRLIKMGFSCDPERKDIIARYDVRERMANLPKHRGELPNSSDWYDFRDVYIELRRLVSNFVASERTAPLESLRAKTGRSAEEEWDYLFGAAKGFHRDSGYKYILITDRPKCKNVMDLFKIPWSVVLDFDAEMDQPDGLYYKFQHSQTNTLVEWYAMADRVKSISTAIHWVSIAIKDENGERYADKALARKTDKKLRTFFESYHRKHSEPVVVVVSMSDESYSSVESARNLV